MKKIGLVLLVLIALFAVFGYGKYKAIYGPNVPTELKKLSIDIPRGSSYSELKVLLTEQNIVNDTSSFDWVASLMKFKKRTIRSGRFQVEPGWSNRRLIQHLRSGKQEPVNLVINNSRLLSEVAGKVSKHIEPDSTTLLTALMSKDIQSRLGLSPETMMTIFIPNTYQVYWDMSAEQFIDKMKLERDKFWSAKNRKSKLSSLDMSEEEVYTLASIVEKETNHKPEKSTVAGVYLNRLRRGIMLQADPTVVFANKNFAIRRVLNKHLEIDSPYNTYKNAGLPPGPISMASISSIDAVLENEDHKFIYFCAKPGNGGQHSFAKSLKQHNSNARKFQSWLNKQRIFK